MCGGQDAQPGVRAVARNQDDLDTTPITQGCIEAHELFGEREGHTGLEDVVLVRDLIVAIGIDTLRLEHLVRLAEVEERARGDGDDQSHGFGETRVHGQLRLVWF